MMIGDIVRATVIDLQPYGVWLQRGNYRGLLLVVELTWEDGPVNPAEFAQVGDELEVLVKGLHGLDDCYFIASLKDLHPERNPWRDPSQFAPRTRFSGRVSSVVSYGCFVTHSSGAKGLIPDIKVHHTLRPGDDVEVEVESYEPQLHKLLLRPVEI